MDTLSPFVLRDTRFPYKIEIIVISERVEIRDESRVLLIMLARFITAAHDRAPPRRFYRKNTVEENPSSQSCLQRVQALLDFFLQTSYTILSFPLHEIAFSLSRIDTYDLERESSIGLDQGCYSLTPKTSHETTYLLACARETKTARDCKASRAKSFVKVC